MHNLEASRWECLPPTTGDHIRCPWSGEFSANMIGNKIIPHFHLFIIVLCLYCPLVIGVYVIGPLFPNQLFQSEFIFSSEELYIIFWSWLYYSAMQERSRIFCPTSQASDTGIKSKRGSIGLWIPTVCLFVKIIWVYWQKTTKFCKAIILQ